MNTIISILKDIASEVMRNLDRKDSLDYSLLGGDLGCVVLLYQMSFLDASYSEKADACLDRILKDMNDVSCAVSYCNGLGGLGIGLDYLEREGYVQGADENMQDFDMLISCSLNWQLEKNMHDFLHGFIGLGFYYLVRYPHRPEFSKRQLLKIVDYLYDTAILNGKEIYWISSMHGQRCNISLSHGMSSTNLLLLKVLSLNIDAETNDRILHLLRGSIAYILSQRIDSEKYGSCFPTYPIEQGSRLMRSRLAWCYGDLGISISLFRCGKFFQDNKLLGIARDLLLFNARRLNPVWNMVTDTSVCHGTSGISTVFYRMFLETRDPLLKNSYCHWLSLTLSGKLNLDSSNIQLKHIGSELQNSVLEGLSGVGLFLQSVLTENWNWTEFLLLK